MSTDISAALFIGFLVGANFGFLLTDARWMLKAKLGEPMKVWWKSYRVEEEK